MHFDPTKIEQICEQAHELWREKNAGSDNDLIKALSVPYAELQDEWKNCYRFGVESTLRAVEQSQRQAKVAGAGGAI
jgi:hypothetical protein